MARLKQSVVKAFEGQARLAYRLGLRPNHVTALGLAFAILSGLAYWLWSLSPLMAILAPLLALLSGYSDLIDGLMARLYGLQSKAGAMLDSMLDRYADIALILGIWAGGLCDPQSAMLAAIGSLLVSYARARAGGLGLDLAGVGLAERPERLALIVIASWIELTWRGALQLGMLILVFITHMTAAQRAAYAFIALKHGMASA